MGLQGHHRRHPHRVHPAERRGRVAAHAGLLHTRRAALSEGPQCDRLRSFGWQQSPCPRGGAGQRSGAGRRCGQCPPTLLAPTLTFRSPHNAPYLPLANCIPANRISTCITLRWTHVSFRLFRFVCVSNRTTSIRTYFTWTRAQVAYYRTSSPQVDQSDM